MVLFALLSPAIVELPFSLFRLMQNHPRLLSPDSRAMSSRPNGLRQRNALIARLSALNQPQLVIVRYPSPDWKVDQEWVYNSADIDRQRVVFAHDLGTAQNRALLGYYPDRTAWLLTFDSGSGHERIVPYSSPPAQGIEIK